MGLTQPMDPEKKSLNLKSLKFSHWPSKGVYWGYNPLTNQVGTITYPPNQWYVWVDDFPVFPFWWDMDSFPGGYPSVYLWSCVIACSSGSGWFLEVQTTHKSESANKNQKSLEVNMEFWFSSHQPEAKLEPSSNSSLLRSISQNIRKNAGLVL